jgi:hypothetical protein
MPPRGPQTYPSTNWPVGAATRAAHLFSRPQPYESNQTLRILVVLLLLRSAKFTTLYIFRTAHARGVSFRYEAARWSGSFCCISQHCETRSAVQECKLERPEAALTSSKYIIGKLKSERGNFSASSLGPFDVSPSLPVPCITLESAAD